MNNQGLKLSVTIFMVLLQASIELQSPSDCSSGSSEQFYNYLTHQCNRCPDNTVPVLSDIGYCNCSDQYYPNYLSIGFNSDSSCLQHNSSINNSQVILLFERDGTPLNSIEIVTCTGGYPNANKTACISCGFNMQYNNSEKVCKCNSGMKIGQACYDDLSATDIDIAGCCEKGIQQSCQIIMNNCSQNRSRTDTDDPYCSPSDCPFIPTTSFQLASFSIDLGIYASSKLGTNSTTIKNKLQFILFVYESNGNLYDVKPMTQQILPCIATDEDVIYFQSFGLNLLKKCNIDDIVFDTGYFYDLVVRDVNGKFNVVPVRYPFSETTIYRRFKLLSQYNSVKMLFTSIPPLQVPVLNYTNIADNGQFSTSSVSNEVNLVLLAPFIVFMVLVLIIFIINFYKYMKYNPDETNDPYYFFKVLLIFFLMGLKYWGIGLWIFLTGASAYAFCFYKFQQTVYLLLPDPETDWLEYYDPFMAVFYVQFSFILISVFLMIYDLGFTTDYFLIDWEKDKSESNFEIHKGNKKKQASVWRKVLLVNQLYELTINRIINTEFVVLFGILFLKGLNWINLSYQIPNVDDIDRDSSASRNVILSYFIITFVFFIIASAQYILRHLVKIWHPLPYEDFVDLCSISNISVIIFDDSLHGYYLHGMNPLGQAEGSLEYIQSIFEKESKAFGKSRAFRNDDPDQTQIFEVVFPFEIRQAFQMKYKTPYLQKLVGRSFNTSILSKPIPEMLGEADYKQIEDIQNDMLGSFKYYLEGVKTSQFNVKERGFLKKVTNFPEEVELIGRLPIFFKDYWHQFMNVLMSGHEFLLLINTINFINIFYIATKNVFMGIFITMIITRLLIKTFADFMAKRNISKNTLIDDKFFN